MSHNTMSGFSNFFCNFLLTILHLIFSILLFLKLLKLTFLKFIDKLSNLAVSREQKYQLDAEQIVENMKRCSKIPKHMIFALGNESVSYEDLVQIIAWTVPTGIPVLSFYDHKNELNPDKLRDSFIDHYPQLHSRIKWGVSFSDNSEKQNNNEHCLQVNALTSKHGRQLLIDSIKELCHKKDVTLTDRATTEAALDEIMSSKLSNSCNPDFLVISGNVYSTYGLSPWHLTFTEFLTIPSYKLLRTTDYNHIMEIFAGVEQKFGR